MASGLVHRVLLSLLLLCEMACHAFTTYKRTTTTHLQHNYVHTPSRPATTYYKNSNNGKGRARAYTNSNNALSMSKSNNNDEKDSKSSPLTGPMMRRAFFASTLLAGAQLAVANTLAPPGFKRIPTQFIAALGDPNANNGNGAEEWGLWRKDPGPRGVWLNDYQSTLVKHDNVAPAGWKFNAKDWWLEEHGLIMEAPEFPLNPGKYLVTGGRLVTTILTVHPADANGVSRWSLEDKSAKLYDVTHLPCRSARYMPAGSDGTGSPLTANQADFPVSPGAAMPNVSGCDKQDYAVLFVIGVANGNTDL